MQLLLLMRRIVLVAVLSSPLAISQNTDLLLSRAIEEHRTGNIDAAVRDYRAYLKLRPKSPEIESNLGAALAKEGQYEAAIAAYQRALALIDDTGVRLNLAIAYYKSEDFRHAAEELAKVHTQQPNLRQATLLLADCFIRQGKYSQVVEIVEPIARPDDLAAAYVLGTAYLQEGQVEKGQQWIEVIMQRGDSGEARLLLGTAKMRGNDYAGAREDFQKAVELAPQLSTVHSAYGMALVNTGDVANAAVQFREELKLNPNDYLANIQLGALLRQDQDFDAARKHFDRTLLVRPHDPAARYQLALVDLAQAKVELAGRNLEYLVRDVPQFTEAHVTLATVYYRLKRKEEGDRERAIVQRLNAESQAKQPGVQSVVKP